MSPLRLALAATFAFSTSLLVQAGSFDISFFSELDGTFIGGNSALPGRSTLVHDVPGSALTDLGIAAFSDANNGSITTIAKIDINNADTNLWGVGIGRFLYTGAADTAFGGGDGHVEFTTLDITNIVDACQDSAGRYVVAAAVPGANGSGGAKDLALLRFTAAGAIDTSYSTDGKAIFSLTDSASERDEAILDLECLPSGDYFVGGYLFDSTSTKIGVIAQMPASGNHDLPVATSSFGISSGELEGQVTAVHFNTSENAYAVAVTILGNSLPSRSVLQHYTLQNGNSFQFVPAISNINLGTDHCPTLSIPAIQGIAPISGTDYAVSLLYTDAGNRKAAVGRINIGESLLVGCTVAPFAISNAAVTPPLVYGGRVFVGLGVAPFNVTAVPSQVRAYLPNSAGTSLLLESDFGNNGLVAWQYAFNSSNANNNRSYVQRLYVDPAGLLMAIGTRVWNGNDTDVGLARLGSRGVFNDSFEGPL